MGTGDRVFWILCGSTSLLALAALVMVFAGWVLPGLALWAVAGFLMSGLLRSREGGVREKVRGVDWWRATVEDFASLFPKTWTLQVEEGLLKAFDPDGRLAIGLVDQGGRKRVPMKEALSLKQELEEESDEVTVVLVRRSWRRGLRGAVARIFRRDASKGRRRATVRRGVLVGDPESAAIFIARTVASEQRGRGDE